MATKLTTWQDVKNFFEWLLTIGLIVTLFLVINYGVSLVFTESEGLGTMTAIFLTWGIIGGLKRDTPSE